MRRHLWSLGLIVAAVLFAYSNAPRNGFTADDHVYIETNRFVQDPANLRFLLDPRYYLGTHEVLAGSRPVYLASLLADRALWGGNAAGYHATSVLIHAANSAWLYGLGAALGLPPPVPLLAGLVFGLHPIQTEAVDAVSFRADPLAAFFVFFGLWFYLSARRARGGKALVLVSASALLYALGLLSKEMAATLPLLVLLVEIYFPSVHDRRARLTGALAAYGLVACGYAGFWAARYRPVSADAGSGLRSAVDRFASAMPTSPGQGLFRLGVGKGHFLQPAWEWAGLFSDPSAASWTMIKAMAGYFRLLLYPDPLVVGRAPVVVRSWSEGGALFCLLALILIAAYSLMIRKRDAASAFGAAWCLVALLPVCDLIPLYNPVAERYLYLVTAGAALALASALSHLRGASWPVAGLLLAALLWRTHSRNADWKDDRSLFLPAAGAPQGSKVSLLRAGIWEEDGRWADAIAVYEEVLRAQPAILEARLGLCRAWAGSGDVVRATACYERTLSLFPRTPIPLFAYGGFKDRTGRRDAAVVMYRRAVEIEPEYVEAWVNLGALYRDMGRYKQARACYERALKVAAPGDPLPHYSFATMLEKLGDRKSAAAHYRAALEQDPAFARAREKLERLHD